MATDNTLKLRFNGNSLVRGDGGTGNVEWISGSTDYKVLIEVSADLYDLFNIVLTDKNNEKALEVYSCKIKGNQYTATFKIPRILKTGDIINIGIIAQLKNKNTIIVSNAFPVYISKGIAQPEGATINSADVNNSGFVALLNLFKGGMVITGVSIKSETVNGVNGHYLYINYNTENKNNASKRIGLISTDLIGLGAQEKRNTNTSEGGGAKLGAKSALIGEKEGGAIGFSTEAGRGFAGGSEAKTHEGIAIGVGAKAQPVAVNSNNKTVSVDGIAIGKASMVDKDSPYSTAIGGYTNVINSQRSLAIGGGTNVNAGATLTNSPFSIAAGYRTKGNDINCGIVIGTDAIGIGTKNKNNSTKQTPIALGYGAVAALNGSISIGQGSWAGVEKNQKGEILPIAGNEEDDRWGIGKAKKAEKNSGSSSIAIGRNAKARRSQSIAIGRGADTYRWGTIAIGYDAVAGSTNEEADLDNTADYVSETSTNKTKSGYSAVAIGTYAQAKGSGSLAVGNRAKAHKFSSVALGAGATSEANGAIQLGNGTNKIEQSLQFRDKTIIKDNKLQIDFVKDNIDGLLSVSKGGTGANTGHQALRNLGIQRGTLEITIESKNKNSAGNVYANFSHTFELTYKDGTRPTVVATLHDTENKGTAVSDRFGINIVSTTNKKFGGNIQVGPNYKGEPYDPDGHSNTVHLDWIAIGTPNT